MSSFFPIENPWNPFSTINAEIPLVPFDLSVIANIINVSGGKDTVKIVKKLREIDPNFPIIATGGPTEETVREVIQAGANAVTFTPPTNGEIFKGMMEEYRHRYD